MISQYADQTPSLQYADAAKIGDVQDRLLRKHLAYAFSRSPFYRSLAEKLKLDLNAIGGRKDLVHLPFTSKADLTWRNEAFLAARQEDIVDVCLTSATTGPQATMLLQTASDLSRLAYNEAQAFEIAGLSAKDTLVLCVALDRCFMAGVAYFLGGTKIGARVVRSGSGNAAQHWEMIDRTAATVIVGVPSLLAKITDEAFAQGKNPKKLKIERFIAIGESIRNAELNTLPFAEKLEMVWGAPLLATYASTEMATAFCECAAGCGGHLRPDLAVVEIVDDRGRLLPSGSIGEVVVTPLGVAGMPLVRFRTGDMAYLIDKPCTCGRTTGRLSPVVGRKEQMLKYKGTSLFPNAILGALEGREGFWGGIIEAHEREDGGDRVVLLAWTDRDRLSKEQIASILQAKIRVIPEIVFIDETNYRKRAFVPGKRKQITFYDLRGNSANKWKVQL